MLPSLKLSRDSLVPDLGAGLTVALVSIPEGMAYAIVAGVDPIYGLYTGMVSTIVAALTSSTSLLIVTLTNALALVAGEQLVGLGGDVDPLRALFTLTFLTGVIMFALGALKLGSVIRFVSREVMGGFVFATALLIALGQYKDLVGYRSLLETNKLFQAVDITLHAGSWNVQTAIVGGVSILVLFLLKKSRVRKFADVLIIFLATIVVLLSGWEGIEIVGDISAVPSGIEALPLPVLPDLTLIPALLAGALAAVVVGLAESSGVGATYHNPDGTRSNMSGDFVGQGLGNIAGSFFQAMPAGGSLSRTGINASGGALSRWAGVYSGLLMALILVLFGRFAELIPMTGLAALLIVIGIEVMIKEGRELTETWYISKYNTAIAVVTILIGAFTDLTNAIFAGVILSLLLYAVGASNQYKVVALKQDETGVWEEHPAPEQIPSNQPTVIGLRGSASFASVYSFDELLPRPDTMHRAVIIFRARERQVGSITGLDWFKEYSLKLRAAGNRFMISDVGPELMEVFEKTGSDEIIGRENIFPEESKLFASTEKALTAAEQWIAEKELDSGS